MFGAIYKPLATTEYVIIDLGLLGVLADTYNSTKLDPRIDSVERAVALVRDIDKLMKSGQARMIRLGFCAVELQDVIDLTQGLQSLLESVTSADLEAIMKRLLKAGVIAPIDPRELQTYVRSYGAGRVEALKELQKVIARIKRDISFDKGLIKRPTCVYWFDPRYQPVDQLKNLKKNLESTKVHERLHAYVRLKVMKHKKHQYLDQLAVEYMLSKLFEEFGLNVPETFRRISAALGYADPQNAAFLEEIVARLAQLEAAAESKHPEFIQFTKDKLADDIKDYNKEVGANEEPVAFEKLLRRFQLVHGSVRGAVDAAYDRYYKPPSTMTAFTAREMSGQPQPAHQQEWVPDNAFLRKLGYKAV